MTKSRGERIRSSATVLWQIAHGVAKQTKSKRAIGPPKWVTIDDLGQNTHNIGDKRGAKSPQTRKSTQSLWLAGVALLYTPAVYAVRVQTQTVVQVSVCVQRQGVHSGTTQTKNTRPTAVGYDGRSCKGRAQHWGNAGGEGVPVVPTAQWLNALSSILAVNAVWVQTKRKTRG